MAGSVADANNRRRLQKFICSQCIAALPRPVASSFRQHGAYFILFWLFVVLITVPEVRNNVTLHTAVIRGPTTGGDLASSKREVDAKNGDPDGIRGTGGETERRNWGCFGGVPGREVRWHSWVVSAISILATNGLRSAVEQSMCLVRTHRAHLLPHLVLSSSSGSIVELEPRAIDQAPSQHRTTQ